MLSSKIIICCFLPSSAGKAITPVMGNIGYYTIQIILGGRLSVTDLRYIDIPWLPVLDDLSPPYELVQHVVDCESTMAVNLCALMYASGPLGPSLLERSYYI